MSERPPKPATPKIEAEPAVDNSWVDLAEGRGTNPEQNAEVSPAQIESVELNLTASITRLEEVMAKPTDEAKLEDPDTAEKVNTAWLHAKVRAGEAFGVLAAASFGAFAWTGETWNSLQNTSLGDFDAHIQISERLASLQTATPSLMVAAIAVPAIMLGLSKLSKMRREKNLNNPIVA